MMATLLSSKWLYATNHKFTFALCIDGGKVVRVAPCGRRWLMGVDEESAMTELVQRGYDVIPLSDTLIGDGNE